MYKRIIKEYKPLYPQIISKNYYSDCETCNQCNVCENGGTQTCSICVGTSNDSSGGW